MRTWLYDTLTGYPELQAELGGELAIKDRVLPRQSEETINIIKPYLIYGLGNATGEDLDDSTSDDVRAERQFFQIWIHDEGGSFLRIDRLIPIVKDCLVGGSHPPSGLVTVRYLETSSEFGNKTYNTIFRYMRFQGIITRGRALT